MTPLWRAQLEKMRLSTKGLRRLDHGTNHGFQSVVGHGAGSTKWFADGAHGGPLLALVAAARDAHARRDAAGLPHAAVTMVVTTRRTKRAALRVGLTLSRGRYYFHPPPGAPREFRRKSWGIDFHGDLGARRQAEQHARACDLATFGVDRSELAASSGRPSPLPLPSAARA